MASRTLSEGLNRERLKKSKTINSKSHLAIMTRVKSRHLGNGPQRMND